MSTNSEHTSPTLVARPSQLKVRDWVNLVALTYCCLAPSFGLVAVLPMTFSMAESALAIFTFVFVAPPLIVLILLGLGAIPAPTHILNPPTSVSRLTKRSVHLTILGCAGAGLILIVIAGGYYMMAFFPYMFAVLVPAGLASIMSAVSNKYAGFPVSLPLKLSAVAVFVLSLICLFLWITVVAQVIPR